MHGYRHLIVSIAPNWSVYWGTGLPHRKSGQKNENAKPYALEAQGISYINRNLWLAPWFPGYLELPESFYPSLRCCMKVDLINLGIILWLLWKHNWFITTWCIRSAEVNFLSQLLVYGENLGYLSATFKLAHTTRSSHVHRSIPNEDSLKIICLRNTNILAWSIEYWSHAWAYQCIAYTRWIIGQFYSLSQVKVRVDDWILNTCQSVLDWPSGSQW
jgi:hypothetical protein